MTAVISSDEVNTLNLWQLQPAYLLILVYFSIHNASIHTHEVTIFNKTMCNLKICGYFKEVYVQFWMTLQVGKQLLVPVEQSSDFIKPIKIKLYKILHDSMGLIHCMY
jgi:hypothetical protein